MDFDLTGNRFPVTLGYPEREGLRTFSPGPRGNNFENGNQDIREPTEWGRHLSGWPLSPRKDDHGEIFPHIDEFTRPPFEQRGSPGREEFGNMDFSYREGYQETPMQEENNFGGPFHGGEIYGRLSPGAGYYNKPKSPGRRQSPHNDIPVKMRFPPKERRGRSRSPIASRRPSPRAEEQRRAPSPRRERYARPKSPRREEFGRPRSSAREAFPPNRKSRSPVRNEFRRLGSSHREKKPLSPRREEFGKPKSNHREEFRVPHSDRIDKFSTSRSPHRERFVKPHHREDFERPYVSSREKNEHSRSPRREFGKHNRHREEFVRSQSPRRTKFDRNQSFQKIEFDKPSFHRSGSPGNFRRPPSPAQPESYREAASGHRFGNDNPMKPVKINEFRSKRGIGIIKHSPVELKMRTAELKIREVKTPDKTAAGISDPMWRRSPDSFNSYEQESIHPPSATHWDDKCIPRAMKNIDVGNDSLHVALRSGLPPVGAITDHQMELVKGYLFDELDKFLATNPEDPPKFSQLSFLHGILSIRCENEMSLEWLKDTVVQMPRLWEGATSRIQVSLLSNKVAGFIKARVYLLHEKATADVIKGRLAAQNSWVNVRDWIIQDQVSVGSGPNPSGSVVIFGVPENHIKILQERKCQLHYAFTKVLIRLPKSNKFTSKLDGSASDDDIDPSIAMADVSDRKF